MRRFNFFLMVVFMVLPFYPAQAFSWKNYKAAPDTSEFTVLPKVYDFDDNDQCDNASDDPSSCYEGYFQSPLLLKEDFSRISPFYQKIIDETNACKFDVITAGFMPPEFLNEFDRSFVFSSNNVSSKDITVVSCKKSMNEIQGELKWVLRACSVSFCKRSGDMIEAWHEEKISKRHQSETV